MRVLPLIFCHFFLLFQTYAISSQTLTDEQKIEHLIVQVEKADIVFIRNGSEHSAKEAASHLRLKLRNAKSSFFFWKSDRKITVKEFIFKIASKSSMSGKSYYVKDKSGKKKKTSDWLLEKLINLNKNKSRK